MLKYSNQQARGLIFAIFLLAVVRGATDAASEEIVYNMESFLRSYYSEKPNREIEFVKKHFPSPDTVLSKPEYTEFLSRFLNFYIDDLPEDDDMLEEALLFHREQSESYIELHKEKDQKEFSLTDAMKDIGLGNLLVHTGAGGINYSDFSGDLEVDGIQEEPEKQEESL